MDNQVENKTLLKKLLTPKLILFVLGLIILAEVIFAINTLREPIKDEIPRIQPMTGGKIILVSPKKEYRVGETIPVSVRVSTGGHPTDGTDLVLQFDPQVLEASGSSALRRGRIYADYPVVSVESKEGVIRISGITSGQQKSFNGIGVFAILNLKAKQVGKTGLSVSFKKEDTDDSNIIESKTAKDILDQVYNLDLTIK